MPVLLYSYIYLYACSLLKVEVYCCIIRVCKGCTNSGRLQKVLQIMKYCLIFGLWTWTCASFSLVYFLRMS